MHRDLKPENFLLSSPEAEAEIKVPAYFYILLLQFSSFMIYQLEIFCQATDFGLSIFFQPGEYFRDIVGSAYYVAPEASVIGLFISFQVYLFLDTEFLQVLRKRYGKEADIWSIGVILYILLSGVPPFWGDTEQQIFDSVLRGKLDFESKPWPSISGQAKMLVKRMLIMVSMF